MTENITQNLADLINSVNAEIRISDPDQHGDRMVVTVSNGEATYRGTLTKSEAGYRADPLTGSAAFFCKVSTDQTHNECFYYSLKYLLEVSGLL